MTAEQAIAFIRERGVVLASARGPVPSLAEMIVNEPIRGSWWAHPKSHQIFRLFQKVSASSDILVCRLAKGKLTFVHRKLWPAMVRAKKHFSLDQLTQAGQEHTPAGYHVRRDVPFPKWVPAEVLEEAQRLSEREAVDVLARAGVLFGVPALGGQRRDLTTLRKIRIRKRASNDSPSPRGRGPG